MNAAGHRVAQARRDYFVTLGGDVPAAKIIEQATFRHPAAIHVVRARRSAQGAQARQAA